MIFSTRKHLNDTQDSMLYPSYVYSSTSSLAKRWIIGPVSGHFIKETFLGYFYLSSVPGISTWRKEK